MGIFWQRTAHIFDKCIAPFSSISVLDEGIAQGFLDKGMSASRTTWLDFGTTVQIFGALVRSLRTTPFRFTIVIGYERGFLQHNRRILDSLVDSLKTKIWWVWVAIDSSSAEEVSLPSSHKKGLLWYLPAEGFLPAGWQNDAANEHRNLGKALKHLDAFHENSRSNHA